MAHGLSSAGTDLSQFAVSAQPARKAGFWTLAVGSIGVVYGDIGTSPLYAFRESINAAMGHGGTPGPAEVLGVLSLMIWALILVVTVKYVLILLYADNHGEGGTLSLMALARGAGGRPAKIAAVLGVIGAALFYGDAALTPAVSVLSAVEGIKLVAPQLDPFVLPITIVIIFGLFAVQSSGTARVAAFFGPITMVWFLAIAVAGLPHLIAHPGVLAAFNPAYGASFMLNHGFAALLALGAVFLTVTGAEALYADLGHFGRKPIQLAWLAIVLPSLLINYLGQGALVLADPAMASDPFFKLVPDWALLPMVVLATAATIIASQAVISGAFSLTSQAIQLGLLPRLDIRHTSEAHSGQIYIPVVNWLVLVAVLLLVVIFKTSSALASAYGIAVTGTMVVTALMAMIVMRHVWKWSWAAAILVMLPFLVIDLIFLGANSLKIMDGGFVPLVFGAALCVVMWTWRRGTGLLSAKTAHEETGLSEMVAMLAKRPAATVKGTAVFLTAHPEKAPTALLHNLKHNKVLHETNVMLCVITDSVPRVPPEQRITATRIDEHFWSVTLRYGYYEQPDVPKSLFVCKKLGLKHNIMSTSFFLSRRSLKTTAASQMPRWQDNLFVWLSRRATDAAAYFQIPPNRAVEVGAQVAI
jgi:KUP system potassium uptake protein